MKNKMLIMFVFVIASLLALNSCSNTEFEQEDAKTLIMSRVPKCVNIVKVMEGTYTYYAAVDSTYTIHVFSVSYKGEIKDQTNEK